MPLDFVKKWIPLHYNALSHTTLAGGSFGHTKNIPILSHPPYTPGLAPCGFFSLPKIKTHHFSTVEKVQSSATMTLNSLLYEGLHHSCEE